MPHSHRSGPFSKKTFFHWATGTKSRDPKGLQLEVGARRAPRLLVTLYLELDHAKINYLNGTFFVCSIQL